MAETIKIVEKEEIVSVFDSVIDLIEATLKVPKQKTYVSTSQIINDSINGLYDYLQDVNNLRQFDTGLLHITTSLSGIIDMLDFTQIKVLDPVPYKFYGMNPQAYLDIFDNLRKDSTKNKVSSKNLETLLSALEQRCSKEHMNYRIHLIVLLLFIFKKYSTVAVFARLVESQTVMALELL